MVQRIFKHSSDVIRQIFSPADEYSQRGHHLIKSLKDGGSLDLDVRQLVIDLLICI